MKSKNLVILFIWICFFITLTQNPLMDPLEYQTFGQESSQVSTLVTQAETTPAQFDSDTTTRGRRAGRGVGYSTYLGKGGLGSIYVDELENTYVVGAARSDYPIVDPNSNSIPGSFSDPFITKLNPSGSIVFSTFLGGNANDGAKLVKVDNEGNIILIGTTYSDDFPIIGVNVNTTFSDYGPDGFFTKLDKQGEIMFSTFMSLRINQSISYDIVDAHIDELGNTYIILNGGGRVKLVVFDINNQQTIRWQSDHFNYKILNLIVNQKAIYVTGRSKGSEYTDIIVEKYDHTGRLLYSNNFTSQLKSIDRSSPSMYLDNNENLYIAKYFDFGQIGIARGGRGYYVYKNSTLFILKVDRLGKIAFQSQIASNISVKEKISISVDKLGFVYLLGTANNGSIFTSLGARSNKPGGTDIYLIKTSAEGEIISSTFFGGSGNDEVHSVQLTSKGIHISGWSSSPDFPIKGKQAYIRENNDQGYMFVAVLNDRIFNEYALGNTTYVLLAILALSTLIGSGYYLLKYRPSKIESKLIPNEITSDVLDLIFNGNTSRYLFLSQIINKKSKELSLETQIPDNIFKYKFLMHPVRLAMIRILAENSSIASTDLKNKLDISWGEFHHHIRNMEKRGLVQIEDTFIEGIKKQTILVEQEGLNQYNSLVQTLMEFLTSTNYDEYQNLISSLYPKYEFDH